MKRINLYFCYQFQVIIINDSIYEFCRTSQKEKQKEP